MTNTEKSSYHSILLVLQKESPRIGLNKLEFAPKSNEKAVKGKNNCSMNNVLSKILPSFFKAPLPKIKKD